MHILVIYFTVVPAFFFVLIKDVSKRKSKPKIDYEGCKNESGLAPGGAAAAGRSVHRRAPRRARAGGRAREPRDLESLSRGRTSRRIRSHELIIDKTGIKVDETDAPNPFSKFVQKVTTTTTTG